MPHASVPAPAAPCIAGATVLTVTRVLYVAAGGGGDVIAAAIIAANDSSQPASIATLSWDRLIIDPVPGPRSTADFLGLVVRRPDCVEVTRDTRPVPPAGSLLPRLAKALPARLFLLDPSGGTTALARQLRATLATVEASELALVDVGGDIVALGTESGLRSPLADALVLAGCLAADVPVTALVCGPGLDGELTETQVIARCRSLSDTPPLTLTAQQVRQFRPLFHWHPSEATGLLAAAATGRRGVVEMRDAGSRVAMTALSSTIMPVPHESLAHANPFTSLVASAKSLDEADAILRTARRQRTELDYERMKAAELDSKRRRRDVGDLSGEDIDVVTEAAHERGVDFVTIRRLAEMLNLRSPDLSELCRTLASHDARRIDPPLWEVRPYRGR